MVQPPCADRLCPRSEPTRSVIHKGRKHRILPTSPDSDEFSKDWTEYQEELARRRAGTLHKELHKIKRSSPRCAQYELLSYSQKTEEVITSTVKPIVRIERLDVQSLQWCFSLHMMGDQCLIKKDKHEETKKTGDVRCGLFVVPKNATLRDHPKLFNKTCLSHVIRRKKGNTQL